MSPAQCVGKALAGRKPLHHGMADVYQRACVYNLQYAGKGMLRSYHPQHTGSRPITAVKLGWASPVLR